jgi:hypothetical protein
VKFVESLSHSGVVCELVFHVEPKFKILRMVNVVWKSRLPSAIAPWLPDNSRDYFLIPEKLLTKFSCVCNASTFDSYGRFLHQNLAEVLLATFFGLSRPVTQTYDSIFLARVAG